MKFKEGLLNARSHIVFLLSLTITVIIIFFLNQWKPSESVTIPSITTNFIPYSPAKTPKKLTPDEMNYARIAWKYFQNNYQKETGMINSVDNYTASALWDTGGALLATIAARELTIIDDKQFNTRVGKMLGSLEKMPLYDNKLPNLSYNTKSLIMVNYANKPTERGLGWSAKDIGRILVAFQIISWNYPDHGPAIKRILTKWKLQEAIKNGVMNHGGPQGDKTELFQEGRLGYEQYGAKAFLLYGLDANIAARYDLWMDNVNIYGVEVPYDKRKPKDYGGALNFVVSEPYILMGLEFDWDDQAKDMALRVLKVQEERFKREGILTAASEDQLNQAPYFCYFAIYCDGKTWVCVNNEKEVGNQFRNLSTKASFAWNALCPKDYTYKLVGAVKNLNDPKRGWYAGKYENGKINDCITSNTNAIVLESLFYKERGKMLNYY